MHNAKVTQKIYHDQRSRKRSLLPGEVISKSGPLSYIVNVEGREERKHADHLRTRTPGNNYHSPNQNEISAQPDAIISVSKENIEKSGPNNTQDECVNNSEQEKLN
ncbi:hypothetical protein RF11_11747 [Thelohanellus kitauei]|uniref:Uncharacterized protein n=1 Tax=Thelohanellus kitauei TaxID=669202 RepID=A0A0C2N4G3_THEKT|nr:hypothetical protein RF11_11747 [Thelohanellus kitauei]